MKTKPTVKNASPVPGFDLSPTRRGHESELGIRAVDFCTGQDCQSGKLPTQRLKMKANCEKKRLLVKQNRKKAQSDHIQRNNPDNPSGFVIDYLPLCFEEDLEMLAFMLAKDHAKKAD